MNIKNPVFVLQMTKTLLLLLGLGLGWTASPAHAGATGNGAKGLQPELLYHNYCSVCHGDRGDGRSRASRSLVPPPRDFTTATNLTRETMIEFVKNGKPGTAMSAWKTQLSDQEIEAVVDYIRNGFMQAALDPRVGRGRSVYGHYCASCHGESGKGPMIADPKLKNIPDLSSEKARTSLNRARLLAAIKHGKPGTPMEGFGAKLPAEDIEAVADYLQKVIMMGSIAEISGKNARALKSRPPQAAPAAPQKNFTGGNTFPNNLAGNAQRGEKSYQENCSACHGAKGDGQGPRAYFISPKPRSFVDRSSAMFNRPMLFVSISNGKPGTVMPAWNQVMGDQEIADIAEFVYTRFIQPQQREAGK
jgi:mono/diheme cytochrome c family protein